MKNQFPKQRNFRLKHFFGTKEKSSYSAPCPPSPPKNNISNENLDLWPKKIFILI